MKPSNSHVNIVDLKKLHPMDEALELMYFGWRGMTRDADRYLATLGLTRVHHRILYSIARGNDLTVSDLLAILDISKQALHRPMTLLIEKGYATATDLADWLVRTLKMPFRDAHHVTGRIVAKASEQGLALHKLPLAEMQAIEPKITAAALDVLSVQASVESRTSYGGTAPANVRAQAKEWLKRLEKEQNSG